MNTRSFINATLNNSKLLKDKERFERMHSLLAMLKEQVLANGKSSYDVSSRQGRELYGSLAVGSGSNRLTYRKFDGQTVYPVGYVAGRFEVEVVCEGVTDTLPELVNANAVFLSMLEKGKGAEPSQVVGVLDGLSSAIQRSALNPIAVSLGELRKGPLVPLTVFVVSKLNDAVGNSTEYYVPVSPSAMAAAVLFGLFKFGFLGWFVFILAGDINKTDTRVGSGE